MPIKVHCPNPACARVHLVKDRYAGMRGKCPACNAWMYVPTGPIIASSIAPPVRKAAARLLAGTGRANGQPDREARGTATALADEPRRTRLLAPTPAPAPAREEPAPQPAKKYMSWMAIVLLLFGILSLGAIAAAPFLPPPDIVSPLLATPAGISAESTWFVVGAPAVVAFLASCCLLWSAITRRFGFISVSMLTTCVLASALLLLWGLQLFHRELGTEGNLEQVLKFNPAVPVSPGLQFHALAGGAAAACIFFTLAGAFMYRRWWARMLSFFCLAFWPALVAVWVYRTDLGLPL
jgi:hypothetical protein